MDAMYRCKPALKNYLIDFKRSWRPESTSIVWKQRALNCKDNQGKLDSTVASSVPVTSIASETAESWF
jgi:hypothetical protein